MIRLVLIGSAVASDVVDVEEEEGAALGAVQCLGAGRQAVAARAVEIDAPLEVDVDVAGRRNRPVLVPVGVVVVRGRRSLGDRARFKAISMGSTIRSEDSGCLIGSWRRLRSIRAQSGPWH